MESSRTLHARSLPGFLRFLAAACLALIPALAQNLQPVPIGGDSGSIQTNSPSSYAVTGLGSGTVTVTDQLMLAARTQSGNFDVQVRLLDLDITNPHVRAGLMARANTNANSPFAAAFASSPTAGCFAESRVVTAGNAIRASAVGGFPSVQPNTWLRLRRSGNQFTAFASIDGTRWTQLGTTTIELPADLLLGIAVSSQNRSLPATGQFTDFGNTTQTTEAGWTHVRESATPSSRRTGLVFSEIQYHPLEDDTGLEFIEVSNHGDAFQELTGWSITGGVEYRFPDGFILEAGASVVVASSPARIAGAGRTPVLGPWSGNLNNSGEVLELRDNLGAIKLHLEYSPDAPWPVAADGTGHSLVLISPSYGEEDPRAWAASWRRGGSPGRRDPLSAAPVEPVVINEFLAHTDLPALDFIELYNRSATAVDLAGWILTDTIGTNRFRIPAGTVLEPGTAVAFTELQLGFRLAAGGESIFFLNPDATRVVDCVRFGGQENGVASGRHPNGGSAIRRLDVPTPGAPNAPVRPEAIVLNEIFYNPPAGDDDEFIEVFHRGDAPLSLQGWRVRGGIEFDFPAGTTLLPGAHLVVARNPDRLRANHPSLPASSVVGPFSGTLGNGGDVVRITMPDEIRTTNDLGQVVVDTIQITVSEVRYADGGAWGKWSDGGGSSLELIDPDADPTLAASWADSNESNKASWSTVEWTGRLDNGYAGNGINRLHLGLLNDGECLVDDIQVLRGASTNFLPNGNFESGTTGWLLGGNHAQSTITNTAARNGTLGLHLRAQGGLDTALNSIRGNLGTGLANGNDVTFRASVRWIAGWPELLFRLRGNFADFAAPLPVPANLGSPGRANSRRLANAGPAVHEVTHSPALPRANESVLVTARASDPDAVTGLVVRLRIDPATATTDFPMRDDGQGGDLVAGDGLYTALINGRASGQLAAFTIVATDGAGASSIWPREAPADEALIRWGDPVNFNSFPHVHLWTTTANRSAAGGNALNNAYRRGTLVYGNTRIIYSTLFRDKGSPFHNGSGDITARTPDDNKLHGVSERLFSKTGNGGVEETGLRGRVSAWIASQMGVPSLSGKYQFFYINGSSFANVVEDQEEPDHRYAEHHQPDNLDGDLYKISIWFEFSDGNTQFNATQATMERFLSNNQLKLARYRWNWERRAQNFPESNYQTIFDLVSTINSTADAGYVERVLQQADIDQWMHVFAFHRVTGNWDSWTYNVGQNMYLYRQPGRRAVLFPWDIDFVLGLGDPASANLWSGQDPIINTRIYDNPAFRRMLWRALARAAAGPMQAARFTPVIDAYRNAQLQNGVTGLSATTPIVSYLNSRRSTIESRYRAADAASFAITSNGGNDFTANAPTVTLTGTAPFRVASIAVNGISLPVTWSSFTTFSINIPLTAATNTLQLVGLDRDGLPLTDTDSIRVLYPGAIPRARDWVVLNEIHYNPAVPGTSFIELHNRNASVPFNLAGFRLDGLGYTFPSNATILPNGYLVLAANRSEFNNAFGFGIPVLDEFTGRLDNDGERLQLLPPDSDIPFSQVRYLDRAPWPVQPDGFGPSLQLVDPALDTRRPANWAATATNAANRVTPGAVNATRATLPEFPEVWINEVVPEPDAAIRDNAGDRAPFVEIHNPGSTSAILTGLALSDSLANPMRWSFPAGTTIAAGGFLRVWLDGEPAESAPGHLHASFSLPAGTGTLVLARNQGSPATPAVLDWIEYAGLPAGRGFGSIPDGAPFGRRPLYTATPAAPNDPAVPAVEVVLNEFLAQNTSGIQDPADDAFEDWIELYNPGSEPADLSGYFLSDNLTNRTASILPPGSIVPAGGFLLVWADGEPNQNNAAQGQFHASFSLARGGEQIGLFAPDGTLIDGLTFDAQTNNISTGRYPDGPTGVWTPLANPSPGTFNFIPGGNLPPRFAALPLQVIPEEAIWSFPVVATDPDPGQVIHYSLAPDAPAGVEINPDSGLVSWTPSEIQGPGNFTFTLRATDNGTPPLTGSIRLRVQVVEANRPPTIPTIAEATVGEGSLLTIRPVASDPDLPPQSLTFALTGLIPDGLSIDPASGQLTWIPAENQGPATYDLTLQVTDDGNPPATVTRPFRIRVEEVDNPPVFTQPSPGDVLEGIPYALTLQATDPDGAPVRYSLLNEPPEGLTLDATTGEIRWTPTEAQGPGTYNLIVRATEQSALGQTAQATFSILVREDNEPPTLDPLPALTRFEGEVIEWTARTTDTDLPPQALQFSIDGSPAGTATIDPASGVLRWELPQDSGPTNLTLAVRVADDVFPPLSATRNLTVRVLPRFRVVLSEILYRTATAGTAYVELLNASSVTPWDLSGATLAGNNLQFTFPAGTILSPGTAICVVADAVAFRNAFGGVARIAGTWSGNIGSNGDDLRLLAPTGEVLDRVVFTAGAPWPEVPPAGGVALQLIDPLDDNARPGNWSTLASFTGPRQPITYTSTWHYFESGAPVGAWTSPTFDDSGWKTGGGLLYNEASELPAPKSTQLTLGQRSYFFRTEFFLPALPVGATINLSHIIDDGAVFHLNGTEWSRFNFSQSTVVTPSTFAEATVDNAVVTGPANLPANLLRQGTNVLAVQVHQINATSSDVVFGAQLDIVGGTVASLTPGLPNNVAAVLPPFPDVFLNEFSPVGASLRDAAGDAEPWVELHNAGPTEQSLTGWTLTTAGSPNTWPFPTGASLRPGERRIVFLDAETGEGSAAEWHASIRPLTANGWLALARPAANGSGIVDFLTYGSPVSGRSWSTFPEGQSFTRQWSNPTPGTANPGPALAQPVLDAAWSPDGLRLRWLGQPGVRYRLESTELLGNPWSPLTRLTGAGATLELVDPAPSADTRFYRLVTE